jgi:coenzyme F420 hydrogenase subunit beta|tara:strand:- start:167 stop:1303 length:1137 start_codon:yes stop_codon:yes gene_type:complete
MGADTFVPQIIRSEGFEKLKEQIVDNGLCSRCGTCAAFCERLEIDEDGPKLIKECVMNEGAIKCGEMGTCYDNCPILSFSPTDLDKKVFGEIRVDKVLGTFKKIVAVKSKTSEILHKSQDGGAVTAFLLCALEEKLIECAIVASRDENWKAVPAVAYDKKSLFDSMGTKYSAIPSVTTIGRMIYKHRTLALVGTGCQIAGFKQSEQSTLKVLLDKKKESKNPFNILTIGLFCYENFKYSKYEEKVKDTFGINLEDIVKNDIIKGKVIINTKDGKEHTKPVQMFNDIVEDCCAICEDFTASFADISVGSIASHDDYSTVIIRSDKGLELLDKAIKKGYVEMIEKTMPKIINKVESSKDKKRDSVRKKIEKEGGYLPTYS